METMNDYKKGNNYELYVVSYKEAKRLAKQVANEIMCQYNSENPYAMAHISTRSDGIVEVWYEYSDLFSASDIRVKIHFVDGKKEAAEDVHRHIDTISNDPVFRLFGFTPSL